MWYLPVIDRLRAIFGNPKDAKLLSWHASDERTKGDGKLRHTTDGKQWKHFDAKFQKEFGNEARNVRFALSTDGMNPFGDLSSSHSTWPVILTIYNLPPWICQKRKYLLLTCIISRPKQPGNDIDVFLEPLMEDMKILWETGVTMLDVSEKKFTLKAIIFVTISDYPALLSLLGQIKGKSDCVVCIDGTYYTYLKSSKKLVYMRHRRFLSKNHRYRASMMNKYFDNNDEPELDKAERTKYRQKVFVMVNGIEIEFRKKKKEEAGTTSRKKRKRDKLEGEPPIAPIPFKKQSCFFKYLSYWKELDTPHAIDCMHLEKNVFESTIGTLLDIKTKTKDGLKSRMDLVNQNIRTNSPNIVTIELNPLMEIDERLRHFLKAQQPKNLQKGRTKYNDPKIEEVEKRIFEVTTAEGSSYRSRQRYKEELIQKGKDDAVKEMIMGKIQDAFTSTDPKMVQLRMQMFEQAVVLPLPGQPMIQGQIVLGLGQHRRYPVNDIIEQTICTLQMPFGRSGRKEVAQGVVLPPDNDTTYAGKPIPPDYAKVVMAWTNIEFEEDELDIPTEDGIRFIGGTIGSCVLWNKSDILLEILTPASQPSQPSSSPAASPSDHNEGGGDPSNCNT